MALPSWDDLRKSKLTPQQHRTKAEKLFKEHPNPATPRGRIAHAEARMHLKTATEKMLKTTKAAKEAGKRGKKKIGTKATHGGLRTYKRDRLGRFA